MTTLYGIPNCDTVKKARDWLSEHGINYAFHDYKKVGIDEPTLRGWISELGWPTLLNRRGTTWRQLPQKTRDNIDEPTAVRLMLENPGMIRRPVLDTGGARHVGFKPEQYEAIFA